MSKRETYESKTEALLTPIAQANGVEIYDVEYVKEGADWYLRAYIDKPDGVNIQDCENVSRALSDALDKEDRYKGKVFEFTAMVLKAPEFPKNYFVPGRMAMTCCEADMTFLGFICKAREARLLETGKWVKVRAKMAYEFWQDYDGIGPVLYAESVVPAEEIKEIVQF